jgi:hypothetical protein
MTLSFNAKFCRQILHVPSLYSIIFAVAARGWGIFKESRSTKPLPLLQTT